MKKTIIGFLFILSGCATTNNDMPEKTYSIGEKRNLEQIIEERKRVQEQKVKEEDSLAINEINTDTENVSIENHSREADEPIALTPDKGDGVNSDQQKTDDYGQLSQNQDLKDRLLQLKEDYERQRRQIESLSHTEREIIRTRFDQEINRINKDRELELRKINLEYDYIAQGIEKDYKKELSAVDSEEAKILRDLELEHERSVLEEEEKFISDYIFNFGTEMGSNNETN